MTMQGSGRWGAGPYLESLHRTYGVALPKRDDKSFQKALDFRMKEKQYYKHMEQENASLRAALDQSDRTVRSYYQSSSSLLKAYKELSEYKTKHYDKQADPVHPVSDTSRSDRSGVLPEDTPAVVLDREPTVHRDGLGGSAVGHTQRSEAPDDGLRGQELYTDSGGQSGEPGGAHGSEHGDRSEQPDNTTDAE